MRKLKNHTTGGTVLLQNNTKYDVIFKAHISSSRRIVNEMKINYKITRKQIRLLRPLMPFLHNSDTKTLQSKASTTKTTTHSVYMRQNECHIFLL